MYVQRYGTDTYQLVGGEDVSEPYLLVPLQRPLSWSCGHLLHILITRQRLSLPHYIFRRSQTFLPQSLLSPFCRPLVRRPFRCRTFGLSTFSQFLILLLTTPPEIPKRLPALQTTINCLPVYLFVYLLCPTSTPHVV